MIRGCLRSLGCVAEVTHPKASDYFCERIGVTRKPNTIELQILEGSIRDDLEGRAHKAMAVLDPLKVVVTNWDQDPLELDVAHHLGRPELGSRVMLLAVSFTSIVLILSLSRRRGSSGLFQAGACA